MVKVKIKKFVSDCISDNSIFQIYFTRTFKQNFKKLVFSTKELERLCQAIRILSETGDLSDPNFKTHKLKGKYQGLIDSHILPDLILIWDKQGQIITLFF